MDRSVICSVLFVCALLAAFAASAPAAYVVRVSDVQYSPTPPNPIKVVGRMMSASPLKLSDGNGEITVVGTTAAPSGFLVVPGDWDGSVLTVSGAVEQVLPPAPCEMVYIPAGSFLMGDNGSEGHPYSGEVPQHRDRSPHVLARSSLSWRGRVDVGLRPGDNPDAPGVYPGGVLGLHCPTLCRVDAFHMCMHGSEFAVPQGWQSHGER